MERLDFASVMAVLRRNILDENFGNQADFLDSLFLDMGFSPQTAMEFDQGQICRWINGLARLSPNIISFYQDSFNQRKLVSRIKNMLLPMMPDSAMAAQELYDLVLQAPNVSPQKKMELTDGYTFEDENDEAIFIMEILCLAMQLRFEKRDVRKKQLLTLGNLSPAVVDYIFDTDIPDLAGGSLGGSRSWNSFMPCWWITVRCFCTAFPVSAKVSLPRLIQSNMARNTPMSSM